MHYLIYLLGPFALGIIGANRLHQRFRLFVIGMAAFLGAWIVCQTIASVALIAFHVTERSFAFAIIASLSAGLVEEGARYMIFSRAPAFRDRHDWPATLTYALGHHGMETIIVGLTLGLIALVLKFNPGAISDPVTLRDCQAAMAVGGGLKFYNACERLSVGLLIHACFSGVVMLAVARRQRHWLLVAMGWHFVHNMIGLNLHRLSAHWLIEKTWIIVIVIGYSFLVVRIYQALRASSPHSTSTPSATGAAPMILPGRAV